VKLYAPEMFKTKLHYYHRSPNLKKNLAIISDRPFQNSCLQVIWT